MVKTSDAEMIRLLLVDDEEAFRATMVRRLGKRGFALEEAGSGEEGLRLLAAKPADVVILDVKMPGMTGLETLKMIKQQHDRIQVILLTGNAAVPDGVDGIKAGAFDYLTKPVDIDHLINKILQAHAITRLEIEKQAESEYREKMEKKMIETERLAALGTMATGIAHEINNPLAVINEAAGFMKEVLNGPDTDVHSRKKSLEKGIEKIENSIKRARRITHQLLGYVRKQDQQAVEVDLKMLIENTLEFLERDLKDRNVSVAWETDSDIRPIWSDPHQIRQVLINVLTNAVQAIRSNGIISIALEESRDSVTLKIRDTGDGISKENIGKIFDPFFTTKPFDEGTGLGLFVVHKIISGLGGVIEVESVVGKGTCFTFRLPKKK